MSAMQRRENVSCWVGARNEALVALLAQRAPSELRAGLQARVMVACTCRCWHKRCWTATTPAQRRDSTSRRAGPGSWGFSNI